MATLEEEVRAQNEAIEKLRHRRFGNKEYDEGIRALFSERDAFDERMQCAVYRIDDLERALVDIYWAITRCAEDTLWLTETETVCDRIGSLITIERIQKGQ